MASWTRRMAAGPRRQQHRARRSCQGIQQRFDLDNDGRLDREEEMRCGSSAENGGGPPHPPPGRRNDPRDNPPHHGDPAPPLPEVSSETGPQEDSPTDVNSISGHMAHRHMQEICTWVSLSVTATFSRKALLPDERAPQHQPTILVVLLHHLLLVHDPGPEPHKAMYAIWGDSGRL